MCGQQRPSSDCADVQSGQDFRCLLTQLIDTEDSNDKLKKAYWTGRMFG